MNDTEYSVNPSAPVNLLELRVVRYIWTHNNNIYSITSLRVSCMHPFSSFSSVNHSPLLNQQLSYNILFCHFPSSLSLNIVLVVALITIPSPPKFAPISLCRICPSQFTWFFLISSCEFILYYVLRILPFIYLNILISTIVSFYSGFSGATFDHGFKSPYWHTSVNGF